MPQNEIEPALVMHQATLKTFSKEFVCTLPSHDKLSQKVKNTVQRLAFALDIIALAFIKQLNES